MYLKSDQPIRNKSQDLLARTPYAEQIAQGILNLLHNDTREAKESFCIAVHGPWGSGKTSLLNLCVEYIDEADNLFPEKQRPIIIRFSPWLISGRDELVLALLRQLKRELGDGLQGNNAADVLGNLEKYIKVLENIKWIPIARDYFGPLLDSMGQVREVVGSLKEVVASDISKAKEDVEKALKKWLFHCSSLSMILTG